MPCVAGARWAITWASPELQKQPYIPIYIYIYIHYNNYMCIYIYIPLHLIIYPDNQIKWLAIHVIKPHEPMNHDLHIISPFEIRCWQKK